MDQELSRGELNDPVSHTTHIEVPIPGEWYCRPANDLTATWTQVTKTPATVSLNPGEAYRLQVTFNAGDSQLAGLAGLDSLRRLDLYGCKEVTNAGLAHLKGLTGLQHLDFRECDKVTDAGFVHLKGLSGLQHLNLWGRKQVTDAGLAHLKWLTGLQHLGLRQQVTDDDLAHLKGATRQPVFLLSRAGHGCWPGPPQRTNEPATSRPWRRHTGDGRWVGPPEEPYGVATPRP